MLLSCKPYIPVSAQLSSSSLPSCGRQVLSDHHIRIVCGRIDAFLVRPRRPKGEHQSATSIANLKEDPERVITNLARLVLGDFVLRMFLAVLPFTIGTTRLGNVDLDKDLVSSSILIESENS